MASLKGVYKLNRTTCSEDILFIYGEEVVLKHPITLDLKETPLTTILQTAFIKQDISFEITKHHNHIEKNNVTSYKTTFYTKRLCIGRNIERNTDRCQYL